MASGEVRFLECKHPRYKWEMKWYEGGKRLRRFFETKQEASDAAKAKRRELKHKAPVDAPATAVEHRALIRARELGVDLLAAVEAYADKQAVERRSLPMDELVNRRLAAAARENLSPRYEAEYKRAMKSISETFGARPAATITTEECADWIYGGSGGGAAATLQTRRVQLSGLFAFGIRIGAVKENPAQRVKPPRSAAVESIGILTPAEARDYLLAVATLSPALLAHEAICLFGGLRKAEAGRLDWSAVQLERGFIEVGAGIAKTRSRRLVDIEPALSGILAQIPVPKIQFDKKTRQPKPRPVKPKNLRRLRNRALKAAGWLGDKYGTGKPVAGARPWPDNALRHSFVSYHLALHGDVARTELQAGHDRKILFAHYRELVTKDAAEEFWTSHLIVKEPVP